MIDMVHTTRLERRSELLPGLLYVLGTYCTRRHRHVASLVAHLGNGPVLTLLHHKVIVSPRG